MKNIKIKYLLIVALVSIGGFLYSYNMVSATTSNANSTSTVEFYGKKSSEKKINSSKDSGIYGNQRLPQTGDFVVPKISLIGLLMVGIGITLLIINNKNQSDKGSLRRE